MNSVQKIFFTTLLLFSGSAFATTVFVPNLPGLFERDGSGIYDAVVKEAASRAGLTLDMKFLPFARALDSFATDTASCFPVGNAETAKLYLGVDATAPGTGYYETKFIVATSKSADKITDLAQLSGMRVAHLTGDAPADLGLDALGAKFTSNQTHEQSFKMIEAGRVDAIVGADTDMLSFIDHIHYADSAIIFKSHESLICHAGGGNDDVVAKFAAAVEAMRADGTLTKLLGALGK